MKTKKIKVFSILFSIFLFTLLLVTPLYATEIEDTVGFTVSAKLPENQINSSVSYFDLLVQPETTQILEIDIYNKSNAEIPVEIATISASTNRNGVIDYTTPNIKDDTMQVAFSEIAKPIDTVLTIPAYSSKTAQIEVTTPEEIFDGTVLGGIHIKKIISEEESNGANSNETINTSVQNRYNYVIGTKLTETDTKIEPHFESIEAKPTLLNYHKFISTSIRNTQPLIIKNISVNGKIYAQGSDTVLLENTLTDIDMAPNSVLEFPVALDGVTLRPGKYVSKIELQLDENTWNFEEPFEITSEQNAIWEIESVESDSSSIPFWAIILIILAILILIILVIFIFLVIKKLNEGKQNEK